MIQLAYVSSTTPVLSGDEIVKILVRSRVNNGNLGITGILLYKDGNVLQVLEGETERVTGLFDIIKQDIRHHGVIELYKKSVAQRDFPDWTMGFRDLGAEIGSSADACSEILNPAFDMTAIKPSAAAALLKSFKSGMR